MNGVQTGASSSAVNTESMLPEYLSNVFQTSESYSSNNAHPTNQHGHVSDNMKSPTGQIHNSRNATHTEIARQNSTPSVSNTNSRREHLQKSFSDPPTVGRSEPPSGMGFYVPQSERADHAPSLQSGRPDRAPIVQSDPRNRLVNFNIPDPHQQNSRRHSLERQSHQNAGIDHRGQIPPSVDQRGNISSGSGIKSILKQPTQPSNRGNIRFSEDTRDNRNKQTSKKNQNFKPFSKKK